MGWGRAEIGMALIEIRFAVNEKSKVWRAKCKEFQQKMKDVRWRGKNRNRRN